VSFGSLLTCLELSEEDIACAARSSESMRALLSRFEQIAAPGEGASILLAALARLATTAACDWLEGELSVEIEGTVKETRISVATTLGGGFREKVLPDTTLHVPFEEFERAIALGPRLVGSLTVRRRGRRIVLTASSATRKTSLPPPRITVDPSCLMPGTMLVAGRKQAPGAPYTLPSKRADSSQPAAPESRKATLVGIAVDPNRPAARHDDRKLVLKRRHRPKKTR
jgi:hypothetical protein